MQPSEAFYEAEKALDRIDSQIRHSVYDDLSDDESQEIGKQIASLIDCVAEAQGPEAGLNEIFRFHNRVYQDHQEIRDPNAPINKVLLARFEAYLSEWLKSYKSPIQQLKEIFRLAELKKDKSPKIAEKLFQAEKEVLKDLPSEVQERLSTNDISIIDDLVFLSQKDRKNSLSRLKESEPTELSGILPIEFKKAALCLAVKLPNADLKERCHQIAYDDGSPRRLSVAAYLAYRTLRALDNP